MLKTPVVFFSGFGTVEVPILRLLQGGVVFWGNYQIYLNHPDPPPKWPQRTPHARQATAVSLPDLLFLCARLVVVAVIFLVPWADL